MVIRHIVKNIVIKQEFCGKKSPLQVAEVDKDVFRFRRENQMCEMLTNRSLWVCLG